MTDHCMRTPAAALYLGIAESTLNKTRLTGNGPPFVKVGLRSVAYRKADLDAWLEARVRRSTSDAPTAPPTAPRPTP
jgi:predicted DNA-binding transcriptional regulator AlpA